MLRKVRCDKCQNMWESKSERPRCKCGSWNITILETLQGDTPEQAPGKTDMGELESSGLGMLEKFLVEAGVRARIQSIVRAFSYHDLRDIAQLRHILQTADIKRPIAEMVLNNWSNFMQIDQGKDGISVSEVDDTERMLMDMEKEELRESRTEYQKLRLQKKIEDLKRGMSGEHREKTATIPMITREIPLRDEKGDILVDSGGRPIYEKITAPAQTQSSGDATLNLLKVLAQLGLVGGGNGGGESQPDQMEKMITSLTALGLVRKPDAEIETLRKEVETLRSYSGNSSKEVEEVRALKEVGLEAIKTSKEAIIKGDDKVAGILDKLSLELIEQNKHQRYMDRLRGGAERGLSTEEEHERFEKERVPEVNNSDLEREMAAAEEEGGGAGSAGGGEKKRAIIAGP